MLTAASVVVRIVLDVNVLIFDDDRLDSVVSAEVCQSLVLRLPIVSKLGFAVAKVDDQWRHRPWLALASLLLVT